MWNLADNCLFMGTTALEVTMSTPCWEHYPLVAQHASVQRWLLIESVALATRTVDAYGRALHDYLTFCMDHAVDPEAATREQIALYLRNLQERPRQRERPGIRPGPTPGLASSTIHPRITAVRLYYDYLVEEGQRPHNPVGRGQRRVHGGRHGPVPRYYPLPWIPSPEQWQAVLAAARHEPIRNRFMLALAYDAALRREELCALETSDIDPAHRLVRVRAETTKNRREREVVYSADTAVLYDAYLLHRRTLSRARGPLFLSESRRNCAQPISIWTWSKVVRRIADRAQIPEFTTHTLRHLCLTDLARDGWDIHEIALFAGHRSTETTLLYIRRSGRELAAKLARSMTSVHARRIAALVEACRP